MISINYGHRTDIGRVRCHNEDSYLVDPEYGLFVISDGMGGHEAGDVASAVAIESIGTHVRSGQLIDDAIRKAHHAVVHASRNGRGKPGMGATAVALHLNKNGYRIAWVGDSRAYLWDGKLRRLTRDQTYVQKLLDEGLVTEEEARNHPERNIITQALGFGDLKNLTIENVSGLLYRGEKILLCSDGLTSELNDHQITHILAGGDPNQQVIDNLIAAANANGGQDNITALLISAADGAPIRPRKGDTIRMGLPQWQRAIINPDRFKTYLAVSLIVLLLMIGITAALCSAEEIASPVSVHDPIAAAPPHRDITFKNDRRPWASEFPHPVGMCSHKKSHLALCSCTPECRGGGP
ncbi:MAG: protein phosphatase 2C domain-containing protein [Desulfobacteraceae bacterium]